jgi:nucleoside-diphosphate-sugar epimerase
MEEGLKAVILNPSIILGPGPKGKASCRLFRAIRQGLRFHPGGSNGFVDVRDVVDACCFSEKNSSPDSVTWYPGINCSYRQLFEWMADELGKPAPTRLIPSYILKHAWLLDAIRGFLTASPREFTREMARSAIQDASYRNDKIKAETGISFRDIHDTLSYLKAYCFSQRNKYCGD